MAPSPVSNVGGVPVFVAASQGAFGPGDALMYQKPIVLGAKPLLPREQQVSVGRVISVDGMAAARCAGSAQTLSVSHWQGVCSGGGVPLPFHAQPPTR